MSVRHDHQRRHINCVVSYLLSHSQLWIVRFSPDYLSTAVAAACVSRLHMHNCCSPLLQDISSLTSRSRLRIAFLFRAQLTHALLTICSVSQLAQTLLGFTASSASTRPFPVLSDSSLALGARIIYSPTAYSHRVILRASRPHYSGVSSILGGCYVSTCLD